MVNNCNNNYTMFQKDKCVTLETTAWAMKSSNEFWSEAESSDSDDRSETASSDVC